MDEWTRKYNIQEMPLDLLMNEVKLIEFADMFLAHTITIDKRIIEMKREVAKAEGELEYVKDKHKVLKEYINFLQFGGHNFVKEMIKDNHHVFENAQETIFGYKICGMEVKVKKDGWHVCIRKTNHKGKCSNTTSDRREA